VNRPIHANHAFQALSLSTTDVLRRYLDVLLIIPTISVLHAHLLSNLPLVGPARFSAAQLTLMLDVSPVSLHSSLQIMFALFLTAILTAMMDAQPAKMDL
jgi:hypothetical protein